MEAAFEAEQRLRRLAGRLSQLAGQRLLPEGGTELLAAAATRTEASSCLVVRHMLVLQVRLWHIVKRSEWGFVYGEVCQFKDGDLRALCARCVGYTIPVAHRRLVQIVVSPRPLSFSLFRCPALLLFRCLSSWLLHTLAIRAQIPDR